MKRIISLLLACIFVFGCVGCAVPSNNDQSGASSSDPASDSVDEGTGSTDGELNMDAGRDTPGIDISKINLDNYQVLSVSDYIDKTSSGHISQYVGFLSGYEFAKDSSGNIRVAMPDTWFEICNGPYAEPNSKNKHSDKLLFNSETKIWEVWNDDDFSIDILNQYIIRDMYEQYGTFNTKAIGDGWVNYDVYDMGGGHRTYGAYALFKSKNYLTPFVGMSEYGNRYGVNGEPYIANETLGMTCAGMPETAVAITDVFASVTSDMDPVLWAKFFSTMYSLAYFEDDIPTLIEQAKKVVPEGCVVHQVIDEMLALRVKYPQLSMWRLACKEAEALVWRHHYGQDSKMGETSINCAFILLGLLWGEGDWFETCRIISLAGHGGDSTTPVGLGIIGVINGMSVITDEALAKTWQDGKGLVVNKPIPNTDQGYWMVALGLPERILMADVIKMYQVNFESILEERGGFRYDGNYYIPKSELGSSDTALYEDFEDGKLEGVTSIAGASAATMEESYMGNSALKITSDDKEDTGAYITVSGLKVGETYRYSSYVYTASSVTTYLFARNVGDTGLGQHASVVNSQKYVLRELTFVATAETMQIGVMIKAEFASHKYAVVDDICVVRVKEDKVTDKVSISESTGGAYKGSFTVTVGEKIEKEAYLKINFSNIGVKMLDGKITINGEDYATAPIYRTSKTIVDGNCDVVYIPLSLANDSNVIKIDIGSSNTIYVHEVSVVSITELFN